MGSFIFCTCVFSPPTSWYSIFSWDWHWLNSVKSPFSRATRPCVSYTYTIKVQDKDK